MLFEEWTFLAPVGHFTPLTAPFPFPCSGYMLRSGIWSVFKEFTFQSCNGNDLKGSREHILDILHSKILKRKFNMTTKQIISHIFLNIWQRPAFWSSSRKHKSILWGNPWKPFMMDNAVLRVPTQPASTKWCYQSTETKRSVAFQYKHVEMVILT